jgi:UDPglucose 6-dehydrogenase
VTNIAVLGLWHQGVVGAACLADFGYAVTATDPSVDLNRLRQGKAPIFEPGLDDLVSKGAKAGRLRFADDYAGAVKNAEFVCLMLDTPVDENDRSDLSGVFAAVRAVAPVLADNAILYVTAQVPIGTCTEIQNILRQAGREIPVAYTPENLRLGIAIERFRKPDLPIIGTDSDDAFARLAKLFAPMSSDWQRTNLATAEMLKHALNGFLAVSICFANELGNLCDVTGANGVEVARLLRLEPRVGPKAMLTPGLGFSGGTLARDMMTLRTLGDRAGIDTPMLDGAWNSNKSQNKLIARRLSHALSDLKGKRVAVLGLTYKPDTSTLRRSAAVELIADLQAAGALVTAHDPAADRTEILARGIDAYPDVYSAAKDADALVLMTPWNTYRDVDLAQLKAAMRGDLLFDTARLWPEDEAVAQKFQYFDIGTGRGAI